MKNSYCTRLASHVACKDLIFGNLVPGTPTALIGFTGLAGCKIRDGASRKGTPELSTASSKVRQRIPGLRHRWLHWRRSRCPPPQVRECVSGTPESWRPPTRGRWARAHSSPSLPSGNSLQVLRIARHSFRPTHSFTDNHLPSLFTHDCIVEVASRLTTLILTNEKNE